MEEFSLSLTPQAASQIKETAALIGITPENLIRSATAVYLEKWREYQTALGRYGRDYSAIEQKEMKKKLARLALTLGPEIEEILRAAKDEASQSRDKSS